MTTQEPRMDEEHFSEDKLLDYLNIELSFDEMGYVESHVRKCKTCKKAMRQLEPMSNKKKRDAEFEQINAVFNKAEITPKSFHISAKLIFIFLFVITAVTILTLQYKGYISISIQQWGIEDTPLEDEEYEQPVLEADSVQFNIEDGVVEESMPVTNIVVAEVISQADNSIEPVRNQPDITIIEEPSEEIINEEITLTSVQTSVEIIEENDSVTTAIPEEVDVLVPISKGLVVAHATQSNQPVPEQGLAQFNSYILNNFVYPEQAKQNQIEGSVIVQFVVTLNGAVDEFKIIKSLGFGCDEAAKTLIQNGPSWKTYVSNDFVEYKTATIEFVFKL